MKASLAHRYEALLKVNEAALTKVAPEAVFIGMCRELRRLVTYDRAGLTLYDPNHDSLKIVALYGPYEGSFFQVGNFLDRHNSQNGWTFEHQSKLIRRDLLTEFRYASEQQTLREGFRSLCSVPLVARGNSLGVVTVVGERKNQFSAVHAEVVQEMSNQMTLAMALLTPTCSAHANTRLLCPKCIGAAGGKKTASTYREPLSSWGKKGGRRRKTLDSIEN